MTVNLRRLPMYYMVNAILPMLLMVILSSFAFWMPINPSMPGSGERMGYAITCLLTIVAVGLFTADKRPMVGETTWMDRWISACLLYTAVPVVETCGVFFLDGIFRNIVDMHTGNDRGHISHSHSVGKFTKYARLVEDAHDTEVRKGKRVMKGVYCVGQHLLCGFVTPRGIDKVCRHVFPVVTLAHLGFLLTEVRDFWHDGRFGLRGSAAVRTLFVPSALGGLVLAVGASVWLCLSLVRWCRSFSEPKKVSPDGDISETASEDGSELPPLIPNPHLVMEIPSPSRLGGPSHFQEDVQPPMSERGDAHRECSCQ